MDFYILGCVIWTTYAVHRQEEIFGENVNVLKCAILNFLFCPIAILVAFYHCWLKN